MWSYKNTFNYTKPSVFPVATEMEVKRVKKTIINLLQKAGALGLSYTELNEDYEKETGMDIPYYELGYSNIYRLIQDIPEITRAKNHFKGHALILKTDDQPTSKHDVKKISRSKRSEKNERATRYSSWIKHQSNKRSAVYNRHRNFSDEECSSECSSECSKKSVLVGEENWDEPYIYETVCPGEQSHVPVIGGSQLIGDDYFLQLSIKYLKERLERENKKSPITCGMVQSGLTIEKAINRLSKFKSMSNKLVINLGTVDIYDRKSSEEMIDDYIYLLEALKKKYGYTSHQITLCTLPPLANVGLHDSEKFQNHASFNTWLRNFADKRGYNLLDLHRQFSISGSVNYNLFQDNARNVSGTKHPHVLWNYAGRQRAMKLLMEL